MEKLIWLLLWFVLYGGSSATVAPVGGVNAPAAPAIAPQLDEHFVLGYGDSAALAGGDLSISFVDVVDDSRCPADVMCAWSGMVVVALQVEAAGEEAQTVELGGVTDDDGIVGQAHPNFETAPGAVVAGYTVEVLAVTPYPERSAAPPADAEYQVQLIVKSK